MTVTVWEWKGIYKGWGRKEEEREEKQINFITAPEVKPNLDPELGSSYSRSNKLNNTAGSLFYLPPPITLSLGIISRN